MKVLVVGGGAPTALRYFSFSRFQATDSRLVGAVEIGVALIAARPCRDRRADEQRCVTVVAPLRREFSLKLPPPPWHHERSLVESDPTRWRSPARKIARGLRGVDISRAHGLP